MLGLCVLGTGCSVCQDLVRLLSFIASWTRVVVSVMLCPSILCVALLMDLFVLRLLSLTAGSQVLALLMLFLCVIMHTMWSGKSLQLLCILPFGMLCLSAVSMMFVKILLALCMLVCMVV